MKRTLAILAGVAAIIMLLLAIPSVRLQLLGIHFRHRVAVEATDRVAVVLSVARSQEIVGQESAPSSQEDEPFQEDHSAGLVLEESIDSVGSELVAAYRVSELASERWDWTRGQMGGARFVTRINPSGLVASLTQEVEKDSALTEESVTLPLFTALWPRLPGGFVRPGASTWTAQVPVQVDLPLLKEPVVLAHRITYRFHRYEKTPAGKTLAAIEMTGDVTASGERTTGEGTLEGVCLVDPETGLTTGAVYRLRQNINIRLEGLPEFRWKQAQEVRLWRVPEEVDTAEALKSQ